MDCLELSLAGVGALSGPLPPLDAEHILDLRGDQPIQVVVGTEGFGVEALAPAHYLQAIAGVLEVGRAEDVDHRGHRTPGVRPDELLDVELRLFDVAVREVQELAGLLDARPLLKRQGAGGIVARVVSVFCILLVGQGVLGLLIDGARRLPAPAR